MIEFWLLGGMMINMPICFNFVAEDLGCFVGGLEAELVVPHFFGTEHLI